MLSASLRNFFPHRSCLLELVSLVHLTSDLPSQKVEVVEVEFVSLEGALVNLLLIMAIKVLLHRYSRVRRWDLD